MNFIKHQDPEIFDAIYNELIRQEDGIELIASENYTSAAVLEAQGCVMTNKYAEGYPGRRYYGGCEFVDVAENIARERCKELFQAEHVNVQPHSGSQANMAVFFSVLKPGDTILAMSLDHGGHLTHGHSLNFSGKLYNIVSYPVCRDTELLDYDAMRELAREHRPKLIIAGASAYSRVIDYAKFREAADEVGAVLMCDMAHIAGLVAAGLHPSPVPHCDFVTTTTHKTLRGPRGGLVLCKEQFAKDLDREVMPGMQGGPLMHVIAAKAIAFKEALSDEFRAYQQRVIDNARVLGESLAERSFRIVSGGTDNHLLLVDLTPKHITGRKAEVVLGKAGIIVNRNLIPYDKEKPLVTSGVRLGSPATTTRGMGTAEMETIAGFLERVIENADDDAALESIHDEVKEFCREVPMYPHLLEQYGVTQ